MATPTVPFALKLPVDLNQQIRQEAQKSGKSIQATIISMLRKAERN